MKWTRIFYLAILIALGINFAADIEDLTGLLVPLWLELASGVFAIAGILICIYASLRYDN
jgi:hypothetical protein